MTPKNKRPRSLENNPIIATCRQYEENTCSRDYCSKRKWGRPPKLQPKILDTLVTSQNGGVGPAQISVVEGAQVTDSEW
ncbi:hypothetical protein Tco_1376989 [Tanacetum coccineum]